MTTQSRVAGHTEARPLPGRDPVVLVVDDDERSRRVLGDVLSALPVQVVQASSGEEALALCESIRPDVILLDLMMPELDGFEVLTRLRGIDRFAHVPVLVVSAYGDRVAKVRAFELGADDFVNKPFDRVELRARVLAATRYHRTRVLADERARFEEVINVSFDGILVVDEHGRVLLANPAFACMLGLDDAESVHGRPLTDYVARIDRTMVDRLVTSDAAPDATGEARADRLMLRLAPSRGAMLPVELTCSRIPWAGRLASVLVIRNDTERRELEAEVRQLQKLDTMGTFALGIAHDFANVLQAMGGAARELARALPRNATNDHGFLALADLTTAITRGGEMTRHLLAFVSKTPLTPSLLDPAVELQETASMLRRLLPPDIRLDMELADDLPLVRLSRTELEQVLINLVVNARNALGESGVIQVRMTNDGTDWVVLDVADNGPGFDGTHSEFGHDVATGTGLGLGIVRRIVYGAHGEFFIDSGPTGTTCRVRLRALPLPTVTPSTATSVGEAASEVQTFTQAAAAR